MRQIDNMTPQELDTMALKGMTASGTVKQGRRPMYKSFVTQRDEYKAHADKLAGALRNALNMIDPFVWNKSKEAAILEAYEAEQ